MDYWLERCSICFDARLELCLDHCRDQYCLDCFRRYITEVVMSSWGLTVTKIRCPVCQTQIPQSEWSQFVPAHVVEHYNRFNRPYRPYSRCCPQCETEAFPCEYKDKNAVFSEQQQQTQTQTQAQAQKQNQTQVQVHTMIQDLLDTLPFYCQGPEMDQLLQIYDHQTWHNATLPEIYRRTMLLLFRTVVDSTAYHSNLLAISHRILLLDMKPDTWKQLQFAHISFFPVHECRACNTPFCLQCGQNAHPKMTCEAAMRHILESEAPSESSETVKWTLEHRQGCNKVDCSLCGFCFCWVCRLPWSEVRN
ncbi:hypothetical protein J3Q64DRAFT_1636422 [Phycomyces blakesleeanus]|uniref:RING-type domain-containing protein n=1 Tax=Phycomyces blakesleeanus TaxID=4837 RepID=A0ABR3B4M3_PHYBL